MRPGAGALLQGVFAYAALGRLARGKERRPALAAPPWAMPGRDEAHAAAALTGEPLDRTHASERPAPFISVVVPARDEAARIAGVLAPLRGAPGVLEVIVVDDRSTDDTATVARSFGARVVEGRPLAEGWIGKPWALQQGLAAAAGDVVVFLDADVEPDPALPAAVAGLLADADLVSAQLAFACPDAAQRILHPALLATLIYRLGPLDTVARMPASLAAINGQCFAARREALVVAGGFGLVAGLPTDDVALARALSAAGWRLAVADGSHLGSVRMYESAAEAIREWAGRSLALPGAAHRPRQLFDLGVIWAVQGLPGLRLWRALLRGILRGSVRDGLAVLRPRDLALLALRGALQLALMKVYRRPGSGVRVGPRVGAAGDSSARGDRPDPLALLAPLADPIAAAALTRGTLAPVRMWRGRPI